MPFSRFRLNLLIYVICGGSVFARHDGVVRSDIQPSPQQSSSSVTNLGDIINHESQTLLPSPSLLLSNSVLQSTFLTRPKPSKTDELQHVLARAEETGQPQCDANYGEISCGTICCSAAEMCMSPGRCVKSGSSPFNSVITPSNSASRTASETSRFTSSFPSTLTEGAGSFTTDFIAPIATGPNGVTIYRTVSVGGGGWLDDDDKGNDGDGNHLSTGAIAGIVIAAILGFLLLLLILGLLTKHCCYPSRGHYESAAGSKHMGCCEWCGLGLLLGTLFCCCRRWKDDSTEKPSSTYYTSYYGSQSGTRTSTDSISSSGRTSMIDHDRRRFD